MDILIRDIDPVYIREIERKAEKLSGALRRNFSRNEYIKMLIQNDFELRLTQLKEDKFDVSIDNLIHSLQSQENTLQEYINSNNRLFHLMASGIDVEEEVDKL